MKPSAIFNAFTGLGMVSLALALPIGPTKLSIEVTVHAAAIEASTTQVSTGDQCQHNIVEQHVFDDPRAQGGNVTPISTQNDWDNAKQFGGLVVLHVAATWAGPSRVMTPIFESMSKKYTSAKFFVADIDNTGESIDIVGTVTSVPTFILFKNGQQVAEVVGAKPPALEAAIVQNL